MMHLVRSELLRIWSRRMVRVLAILAVLGIVVGVMIGAIQSNGTLRLAELPSLLKGTSFILIVLGLVIGSSSVGADWQVGTMAALLTWEPRRIRVFLVRVAVVVTSVFALAVALQAVLSLALTSAAALKGTTIGTESPWLTGVIGTIVRIAAASALGAWVGVTLAMIGRNTAAALGVAFGYLAIVESLLRGYIPKISDSLLSTNLIVFVDGRPGTSETGSLITVGGAAITISLYAGVLLIAGLALFRARDVT